MKYIVSAQQIINVRKAVGWRLELLVEYNTCERRWCMIHGALNEIRALTRKFMKDCGLTYELCGYKTDPTLYKGKKKLSQFDDFPSNKDTKKYNPIANKIFKNLRNKKYDMTSFVPKIRNNNKTITEINTETNIPCKESVVEDHNDDDERPITNNNHEEKLIQEENNGSDNIMNDNNTDNNKQDENVVISETPINNNDNYISDSVILNINNEHHHETRQ